MEFAAEDAVTSSSAASGAPLPFSAGKRLEPVVPIAASSTIAVTHDPSLEQEEGFDPNYVAKVLYLCLYVCEFRIFRITDSYFAVESAGRGRHVESEA